MNCILCGAEQSNLCPKCGFCDACHGEKTTHSIKAKAVP